MVNLQLLGNHTENSNIYYQFQEKVEAIIVWA